MLDSIARSGQLARYDFLHFATHVEYNDQWPLNSALVLAEAQGVNADRAPVEAIDGRLAANEIVDRWRIKAQLVSLAGCTGLSLRSSLADGPYGLGAAFLSAGARSLLVSTTAVDDEACKLFFERLGSLLFAPGRPRRDTATALRDARLWLRDYRAADGSQPYRNPAYWSGFVLVGWPD